jgi:hypothetical protein
MWNNVRRDRFFPDLKQQSHLEMQTDICQYHQLYINFAIAKQLFTQRFSGATCCPSTFCSGVIILYIIYIDYNCLHEYHVSDLSIQETRAFNF